MYREGEGREGKEEEKKRERERKIIFLPIRTLVLSD
jgi:hypothetical protein